MSRFRLLAAGAAAATLAACGAGEAAPDSDGGCDYSDSEWIYATDTDLRQLDLFAYRDGEHVQLTDDRASSYADVSPDGETVAFERGTGQWSECCGYEGHELWKMNVDGSDAAPLVTGGIARAPAWSPDGAHLAYIEVVGDTGEGRIALLETASGEQRVIGEASLGWTADLAWSPDGSELAWVDAERSMTRIDVATGETEPLEFVSDLDVYLDSSI